MKTILCYGDSNTWGQVPLRNFVKRRFSEKVRWTGRLQELAGDGYKIIEEGNNGRTTGVEDPLREGRNGLSYLPACLDSHVPLDLVILMQCHLPSLSPSAISMGISAIQKHRATRKHLQVLTRRCAKTKECTTSMPPYTPNLAKKTVLILTKKAMSGWHRRFGKKCNACLRELH